MSERIIFVYKKNIRDHDILYSFKIILQEYFHKITSKMQEVYINIYQYLLSKINY